MSTMKVPAKARHAEICATVTRADGTVERIGRLTYWHRNPIIRWLGQIPVLWNRRKLARMNARTLARTSQT